MTGEAAVGSLLERVAALERIVAIGRDRDLQIDIDAAARIATSARERLRHGSAHTVVALAGSTGSGKSSLLNAVTGIEIAEVGLTRPTTQVTQAVVYPGHDDADAGALLDWLDVRRRHHLPEIPDLPVRSTVALPDALVGDRPEAPGAVGLRGLLLLDLPDFDSTDATNRAEVERLIALVDLMIWVTDPQKYADQALHRDFLAPLATHARVLEVVLNKADTMTDAALRACLADLDRLLDADGLTDVHPLAVSAVTGQGLAALRGLLAAEVAARTALLDRVEADLTVAAARLDDLAVTGGGGGLGDRDRQRMLDGFARAVGVDAIAGLVAAQHRRDAALRTGWPPVRWSRRLRRAPIASLPQAKRSHVARAEVSQALRGVADVVGRGLAPTWRPVVRRATTERVDEVVDVLDRRTSVGVDAVGTRPAWWGAVAGVHGVLLGVAVVGTVWLALLFVADSLLLLDVEALTPYWRGFPLPTLLLAGGLGLGVLLALLVRPFVAIGARRRAEAARRRVQADVGEVADEQVAAALEQLLADRRTLGELHATVAGDTVARH